MPVLSVMFGVSSVLLAALPCQAQEPVNLNEAIVLATLSSSSEAMVQEQEFELKLLDKVAYRPSLGDEMLIFELTSSKIEMRVDGLQHIYYSDSPGRLTRWRFCYETASGETPCLTLQVNRDDEGTTALIEALRLRRPDMDIAQKTPEEMERAVKGVNLKALMPYPIALLVTAVVVFLFIPGFIHGFDSRHLTVDVAELAAPGFESDTRNLTVKGRPRIDMASVHMWLRDGVTNYETIFPLVSDGWQQGDPVAVFVRTGKVEEATYDAIEGAEEITGVLRNILWEGMTGGDEAFFRDEKGLVLTDPTMVIDYNANPKRGMYFGIPVVVLTALFALVFARLIDNRLSGF